MLTQIFVQLAGRRFGSKMPTGMRFLYILAYLHPWVDLTTNIPVGWIVVLTAAIVQEFTVVLNELPASS